MANPEIFSSSILGDGDEDRKCILLYYYTCHMSCCIRKLPLTVRCEAIPSSELTWTLGCRFHCCSSCLRLFHLCGFFFVVLGMEPRASVCIIPSCIPASLFLLSTLNLQKHQESSTVDASGHPPRFAICLYSSVSESIPLSPRTYAVYIERHSFPVSALRG